MSAPFQRALREELMAAARRGPRRRRWPWAAAAAGLTALIGAVSVLGANPATADVEIRFEAGRLIVTLTDLENSADDVADALSDEGIRAEVGTLPAGPSNVGRFVQVFIDGTGILSVEPIDRHGDGFTGFSVPDDWDGILKIFLGRTARPGEPYAVGSNAFAADEPLHCLGVLGRSVVDSVDELDGLHVRLVPLDGDMLRPPVELDAESRDTYGMWIIVGGDALARDQVILEIRDQVPTPIRESGC